MHTVVRISAILLFVLTFTSSLLTVWTGLKYLLLYLEQVSPSLINLSLFEHWAVFAEVAKLLFLYALTGVII
jgi:hypothetical protein